MQEKVVCIGVQCQLMVKISYENLFQTINRCPVPDLRGVWYKAGIVGTFEKKELAISQNNPRILTFVIMAAMN